MQCRCVHDFLPWREGPIGHKVEEISQWVVLWRQGTQYHGHVFLMWQQRSKIINYNKRMDKINLSNRNIVWTVGLFFGFWKQYWRNKRSKILVVLCVSICQIDGCFCTICWSYNMIDRFFDPLHWISTWEALEFQARQWMLAVNRCTNIDSEEKSLLAQALQTPVGTSLNWHTLRERTKLDGCQRTQSLYGRHCVAPSSGSSRI